LVDSYNFIIINQSIKENPTKAGVAVEASTLLNIRYRSYLGLFFAYHFSSFSI